MTGGAHAGAGSFPCAAAVAHLLVPDLSDELAVGGPDGHHLARVRRLEPGEAVTAGDGDGQWRPYVVAASRGSTLELRASGPAEWEPLLIPRLSVAFALTKGGRPEQVAAHLTELGVDAIEPVHARRGVVRWSGTRADEAHRRLERVVREAAMQCRRARLPAVAPVGELVSLARRPGLVVADPDGVAPHELDDPGPAGWTAVIGPEGGLAPDELEVLGGAPRVAIGRHVLRAETAALAVAAALAARRRPGRPPSAVP